MHMNYKVVDSLITYTGRLITWFSYEKPDISASKRNEVIITLSLRSGFQSS